LAAAFAAWTLDATAALAQQCPNITGNPVPIPNVDLTQKVAFNDGSGSGWGGGDERYKLRKGLFATVGVFDPLATHNLTITFHVDTVDGPLIGSTTVFAGDPSWTSHKPGRWTYNDRSSPWPFGIRRIDVIEIGPMQYQIKKILGRDSSLSNLPLTDSDGLHVMLEIWDALGNGDCADTVLTECNSRRTACKQM
jgi:hypothetical protein